jgi:hypothetical protein
MQKSVKAVMRAKNPKLSPKKQEKIKKTKEEFKQLNGLVARVI